jgi:hypothetical protein
VGLCIIVCAFDLQGFGFSQHKENFNQEEKALRAESGLKFSRLEDMKWSSARCRLFCEEKWGGRPPREGKRRERARAEQGRKARKSVAECKKEKVEGA